MTGPVAFDLDGTLFHTVGDEWIYNNPEAMAVACRPLPGARVAVQRAAQRGVVFITGRSEVCRNVTIQQISEYLGVTDPVLYMQDAWLGRDAMVTFKANALTLVKPVCYVGDLEADLQAASVAGIPFKWPWEVGIEPFRAVPA